MMKQRTLDHPAQYEWTICNCADCRLPDEGPPRDLYQKAVPIWHSTSIEELEDYAEIDRIGYVKAFAGGMEVGLIMANLRPEWARAFYLELRRFYLTTHDARDLEDWEEHADAVCRHPADVAPTGLSAVAKVPRTMLY